MRKTKIICTMGPSCESVEVLKELIGAGMNVARLNLAHGDVEEQRKRIRTIRQAAAETGAHIAIMLDIKGPEVRIGLLKDKSYELKAGERLTLTTERIEGDAGRISVSYQELPQDVRPGNSILIDDGLIELKVLEVMGTEVHCRIVNGGVIKPRKGVNLPGIRTSLPGVTERDVQHILFGIEENIDMIAVSFVRRAEDIMQIREMLESRKAGHIQLISKIENEEGVEALDAILAVSDGLMVARGDLGVEIPVEDVPLIQKQMIHKCNLAGKPVITATHMLDSMQSNPRPTRAEASDVANAVLDGTDVIMLSGETAAGKYPVESVRTMAAIAEKAESIIPYQEQLAAKSALRKADTTEVISQSVVSASLDLDAKAIITPTESGFTARMVSKYRPKAPIIAVTPHDEVLRRMSLVWGVIPVKGPVVETTDAMFQSALDNGAKTGLFAEGDLVVISAGVPVGKSGTTNLIKIQQV
ncbi:pyruvate kinase [Paenibacillus cremeus]|uniref:Pyruvate kinase n=1 Tax=Paenibacillus cremeus TaxID=2163881 RepID=A0A559KDQ5_9BACL|nr:pyruvate kinase [Paenibacillus cremeus]TVY10243.1 pyruvate kinase [Paenibacillus cremeus]